MHPIGNQHRAHNASHTRVSHITKACGGGMSSGGGTIHKSVKAAAMRADGGAVITRADGGPVKARADRPARARGGRLGSKKGTKGHTVNVIVAPSGGQQKTPVPVPVPGVASAPPPPRSPIPAAPPPMGASPMPPPGVVPPPGMPPRYAGGRAFKRGGKVNADTAGIGKGRTPVQHSPNKQDGKNIGRGPVITKATGGPISSGKGKMAPHTVGGAGGGKSRLDKAHHPAKYRA